LKLIKADGKADEGRQEKLQDTQAREKKKVGHN
jgi:hypothetical protein